MSIEAMRLALESMKRALDALESSQQYVEASANARMKPGWGEQLDTAEDAMTALRQAIEQAEHAQPIGHFVCNNGQWVQIDKHVWPNGSPLSKPLYTAPPPRQPLTDDLERALEGLVNRCNHDADSCNWDEVIAAEASLERVYKSRTIEAAHGIKG